MRAGKFLYTSFRLLEKSCKGNKKKPFTRSFVYLCRYSVSQKPPQHFWQTLKQLLSNLNRINAVYCINSIIWSFPHTVNGKIIL